MLGTIRSARRSVPFRYSARGRLVIQSSMSDSSHPTARGPRLMGFGNWSALIRRQSVDFDRPTRSRTSLSRNTLISHLSIHRLQFNRPRLSSPGNPHLQVQNGCQIAPRTFSRERSVTGTSKSAPAIDLLIPVAAITAPGCPLRQETFGPVLPPITRTRHLRILKVRMRGRFPLPTKSIQYPRITAGS